MGVTLHHRAEAVVEVEQLVSVHVPHARALPALEVDRPGIAELVRRGDAADEAPRRALVEAPRALGALVQPFRLALGQLPDAGAVDLDVGGCGHGGGLLGRGTSDSRVSVGTASLAVGVAPPRDAVPRRRAAACEEEPLTRFGVTPITLTGDERERRRRPGRERARPPPHRRLQRLVGAERPRERRERAPPRGARDRALGLPRRRRPLRRDRVGARVAPTAPCDAGSTSSSTPSCPSRRRPSLRKRIIELEASVEARFSQHRGELDGRAVDDNEISQILRDSDDVEERREAWVASKTVGAARGGGRARARAAAQRGGPLARLPRLVRALGHDGRDGRGAS